MKKIISLTLAIAMLCGCMLFAGCTNSQTATTTEPDQAATGESATGTSYSVGVCQLMKHDSLDQATQGFIDALTEAIEATGGTVDIDTQVAGDANLCTTVVNTFTAKNVDLIMGNATPALLAAANATTDIPVLGTSVTDYMDTFGGSIPANVSGTSDAVPFAEQAQMMIDSLKLVAGDKVGVIYCTNESNSVVQYNAVKELFEASGIVVEAYTFSESTELQAVATSAAENSKAIYVPSDNTVAENDSVVGTICNEKNVPVYTSYGGSICYASLAIDYYQLGVETGKMAADILLGNKSVSDIEVATLIPTVTYNQELCAQLGIEVPEN
ncbi:MAG: ABC transporter substrate-binding protein [Oscillospiraceae bacterium]|nr:ABC transporter substrate-binding protein [Oscillospiraceae bacterium]